MRPFPCPSVRDTRACRTPQASTGVRSKFGYHSGPPTGVTWGVDHSPEAARSADSCFGRTQAKPTGTPSTDFRSATRVPTAIRNEQLRYLYDQLATAFRLRDPIVSQCLLAGKAVGDILSLGIRRSSYRCAEIAPYRMPTHWLLRHLLAWDATRNFLRRWPLRWLFRNLADSISNKGAATEDRRRISGVAFAAMQKGPIRNAGLSAREPLSAATSWEKAMLSITGMHQTFFIGNGVVARYISSASQKCRSRVFCTADLVSRALSRLNLESMRVLSQTDIEMLNDGNHRHQWIRSCWRRLKALAVSDDVQLTVVICYATLDAAIRGVVSKISLERRQPVPGVRDLLSGARIPNADDFMICDIDVLACVVEKKFSYVHSSALTDEAIHTVVRDRILQIVNGRMISDGLILLPVKHRSVDSFLNQMRGNPASMLARLQSHIAVSRCQQPLPQVIIGTGAADGKRTAMTGTTNKSGTSASTCSTVS